MATKPELLVIVGETASGKTGLAIAAAQVFNGEVICADSRTVYRGMDIGTAKPTLEEQAGISHYGLDLVNPGERFTVADFKAMAEQSIAAIQAKGKLPIVVGGSGLYIDALLFDFELGPEVDFARRQELEQLSIETLQQKIIQAGLKMPENKRNKRYLIRTLERGSVSIEPKPLRANTLVIGLRPDRSLLEAKIRSRVTAMLQAGFIDEVKQLMGEYAGEYEAFRAPGYKPFGEYVKGEKTLEEAQEAFVRNDLHLAKKQRTWFKRNPAIHWFETPDAALAYLNTLDLTPHSR